MKHDADNVWIKKANVDRRMVKLVKWLNGFEGIHTLYCCEGSDTEDSYVAFISEGQEHIAEVLRGLYKIMDHGVWVPCSLSYHRGNLRYSIGLTTEQLDAFNNIV